MDSIRNVKHGLINGDNFLFSVLIIQINGYLDWKKITNTQNRCTFLSIRGGDYQKIKGIG